MHNQIWKPVQEYNGFYEVSNHGLVRGVDRAIPMPGGRIRNVKEKLLKPKRSADGYLFVSLSKYGVTNTRYIHRLVAVAFIPNPHGLPEVNHKDGNKMNNVPDNLEWCTHQQNVMHAYENGLSSNIGGNHGFAAGVIDNTLGRSFETVKEWCAARGINYSTGRNILNGQKSKRISLQGVFKTTVNE